MAKYNTKVCTNLKVLTSLLTHLYIVFSYWNCFCDLEYVYLKYLAKCFFPFFFGVLLLNFIFKNILRYDKSLLEFIETKFKKSGPSI